MKLTKKHLLVILFSFSLLIILVTPILNSILSTFSFKQIPSIKAASEIFAGSDQQGQQGQKGQEKATGTPPDPKTKLQEVGKVAWGERAPTGLLEIIGEIIKILLGLLGVIAVIFVVVGGFQWMTAGGNEEKIKGAKRVIGQGIVGLVIVLAAYAIAYFVIKQLIGPFLENQQQQQQQEKWQIEYYAA